MMARFHMRHFLTGTELTSDDLHAVLDRAAALKLAPRSSQVLDGRTVALIFQKPSTRTRVSFEAGIVELGGHPMVLRAGDMQLGRGESLRDTARVLGRHVAAVGVRTHADSELEGLAAEDQLPVFNMLTQNAHPCQVLADLLTLREGFGALEGLKLVYVGDGNNMARSLYDMGRVAGVEVVLSTPPEFSLDGIESVTDPHEAVAGANAIYTDVWVSMGEPVETWGDRIDMLLPFQVNSELMRAAGNPRVKFMHCLPAFHNCETKVGAEISAQYPYLANNIEVTENVFESPANIAFEQAENRMHTIKAVLVAALS